MPPATRLAAKLKTPLQIGQHLVRAFEAGFEIGAKPVDETVVEAVLSLRIDDLEPRLTRSGYDVRSLARLSQLASNDPPCGRFTVVGPCNVGTTGAAVIAISECNQT